MWKIPRILTGRGGFSAFNAPFKGMTNESNGTGCNYSRAAIAAILQRREHGARLDIPCAAEVLKTARAVTEKAKCPELFAENDD